MLDSYLPVWDVVVYLGAYALPAIAIALDHEKNSERLRELSFCLLDLVLLRKRLQETHRQFALSHTTTTRRMFDKEVSLLETSLVAAGERWQSIICELAPVSDYVACRLRWPYTKP